MRAPPCYRLSSGIVVSYRCRKASVAETAKCTEVSTTSLAQRTGDVGDADIAPGPTCCPRNGVTTRARVNHRITAVEIGCGGQRPCRSNKENKKILVIDSMLNLRERGGVL